MLRKEERGSYSGLKWKNAASVNPRILEVQVHLTAKMYDLYEEIRRMCSRFDRISIEVILVISIVLGVFNLHINT